LQTIETLITCTCHRECLYCFVSHEPRCPAQISATHGGNNSFLVYSDFGGRDIFGQELVQEDEGKLATYQLLGTRAISCDTKKKAGCFAQELGISSCSPGTVIYKRQRPGDELSRQAGR